MRVYWKKFGGKISVNKHVARLCNIPHLLLLHLLALDEKEEQNH